MVEAKVCPFQQMINALSDGYDQFCKEDCLFRAEETQYSTRPYKPGEGQGPRQAYYCRLGNIFLGPVNEEDITEDESEWCKYG